MIWGDTINSSDPFGLASCTKEETAAGKETVATKGEPACVEQRKRQTDAETACSVSVATGWARTVWDFGTVVEGGAALKMAAKALAAEVQSKVLVGYAANVLGVSGGKLARDAAKTTMAANYMYGNAAGVIGSQVAADAARPRDDNSSFSLKDAIPL